MASFAPVVPPQLAEFLQGESPEQDVFGDYHLLLAHDVLEHSEAYARICSRMRERYKPYIILDNSLVELGTAMDMTELLEAARIVNPDCIVMPDVMGNGRATRKLGRKFHEKYMTAMAKPGQSLISLMVVLQGYNVGDCMQTYYEMAELPLVSEVSVPRVVVEQQGSRMPLLLELCKVRNSTRPIHLLGFSDDILDDVVCARMPIVKGIDSAVPIRAGLQGYRVTLHDKVDYGKRGTYWETDPSTITSDAASAIFDNLYNIRKWIRRGQVSREVVDFAIPDDVNEHTGE